MLVGFVYVCAVWVGGFSGGVGLCGPVVLIVWLWRLWVVICGGVDGNGGSGGVAWFFAGFCGFWVVRFCGFYGWFVASGGGGGCSVVSVVLNTKIKQKKYYFIVLFILFYYVEN